MSSSVLIARTFALRQGFQPLPDCGFDVKLTRSMTRHCRVPTQKPRLTQPFNQQIPSTFQRFLQLACIASPSLRQIRPPAAFSAANLSNSPDKLASLQSFLIDFWTKSSHQTYLVRFMN